MRAGLDCSRCHSGLSRTFLAGYLTSTLIAIVNGHKQSRIECFLLWKGLSG
jgi:hypothetical protein